MSTTPDEAKTLAVKADSKAQAEALDALIEEARKLCAIDYCFGQADRDAKDLRCWRLISRLSTLNLSGQSSGAAR